jgi:glycosyltransferase involved in cell wall biosynthesis
MNLGIFFHRDGSLENLRMVGQDKRFISSYLKKYSKAFDKVYMFSYANEWVSGLPDNVIIVPNKHGIPSSLYAFLMPLMRRKEVRDCDVFRVFHISGTPSSIVTKVFYGKPYITTYGYLWMRDILFHKKYTELLIAKPVEWLGLMMADRVIITIDETKKYVARFVPAERIAEVPNGVDVDLFRKMPARRGRTRRIISIGRLVKVKNYDSLVKAVAKIKGAELVLYGDGPEAGNLERLAEAEGCKLTIGMVPNEKLPREVSKADVFVLPSHSEGMPKALIEAMACEIPCIVSDLPTLREVVKDGVNGLVCGHSPESIREKIEYVLDHRREAGRMAAAARKHITDNLSIDVLVEKEIKLLKDLQHIITL